MWTRIHIWNHKYRTGTQFTSSKTKLYFWGTARGVCSFDYISQHINMPKVIMHRQRFSDIFVDQFDYICAGIATDGKVYVWGDGAQK
jgi:hypothetical protein